MGQYTYNKNAFNIIETEEDAYWLGFILADGYVSNGTKPYLQIKLSSIDRQHLIKFIQYLKYETTDIIKNVTGGAYTKDNPCCVVKISCRSISNNLEKYGLNGAKSGKEIPYILPTIKLQTAYIRGIIDGDGWIRKNQQGWGVCGSLKTLQYIKDFIQDNIIDVSNNSITAYSNIYKFEMTSKEKTQKILNYFYKDATIYLDRKFQLYQQNCCRV